MLRALLPLCDERRVHRQRQPARAAAGDAAVAGRRSSSGPARSRVRAPTRGRALERARRARRRRTGVVLATGSIYLVADLVRPRGAGRGLDAVNDDGPVGRRMIAVVAIIVALVILVFFALGYVFGRLFL